MGKRDSHIIDIVFSLALFCVFAATALLVVLIGAKVYKSTSASMTESFGTRTSLTYMATKIRQNDNAGAVFLTELDGVPALAIEQEIEGDYYRTYIYHSGGELREIFTMKESAVNISDGQAIMDVPGLKMENLGDNLLRFTSIGNDGRETSLTISPRCGVARQSETLS